MKFSDYFTNKKTVTQKEQELNQQSLQLYKKYSDYFRDHVDDYSHQANIKIHLMSIDYISKNVDDRGWYSIYGPQPFNKGTLVLYQQPKGKMLEVWDGHIFKNKKEVGQINWTSSDTYQTYMNNNLDQY